MLLEIKNLHASILEKPILQGIDLQIKAGTVHAIMGPNGSGKSTLSYVLAGHPAYQVTEGTVNFHQKNLLTLNPDVRAQAGLFLSFQYPVEIPGVTNIYLLKAALNSKRKSQGLPEISSIDFLKLVREKLNSLKMDETFLKRDVNAGFSGGEKKRNEILQMAILEPSLVLLDEIDSGLDIDSLRIVAESINAMRHPARSMIMVTHYQRLLNYVQPDFIHVLYQGRIIKSGDKTLAQDLEKHGYDHIIKESVQTCG